MLLEDSSRFTEDYFIASFLSGLSEESQGFINMFQPQTLEQTIDLGRKQLLTLDAIAKRFKPPPKPFASPSHFRRPEPTPVIPSVPAKPNSTVNSKPTTKLLTSIEMTARREKGLCYNCDEKYVHGHRCKNRIL